MAIYIDTELMSLLPDWYAEVKDYQEIMSAEEYELAQLAAFIGNIHDNFFVQSMDEATATAWEQLLGIATVEGQSLEFRRIRILNRITMKPPFTMPFLYKKLDELIGQNKWAVFMDYESYTLYVESSAESQDYAIEVAYTIGQIKPAHIVYINRPLITETMLLSEQVYGTRLMYNYRLGAWAIGVKAFNDKGEEVLYKMASTRSLTDWLLAGVTTYVSGDVASARINDTLVISNLTKETDSSGTVLSITYTVPTGQVSVINKVELLDASRNVLTSSTVYIPVTSEVEMKHRITTQEGTA